MGHWGWASNNYIAPITDHISEVLTTLDCDWRTDTDKAVSKRSQNMK